MKRPAILLACIALLTAFGFANAQIGYGIYLPVVLNPLNTPTLTPTPTSIPTLTPIPAARIGKIEILRIFYNGSGAQEPDEFVEIQNIENFVINLSAWTLRDNQNHIYTFPAFNIQPNQICRVYTNQFRPESCGFSYGSGSAIWNNDGGDCAHLQNYLGQSVSEKCY